MGELARLRAPASWGRAEQAALDRCLQGSGSTAVAPPSLRTPAHLLRLSRTIETEIIPRLMLAHLNGGSPADGEQAPVFTAPDVQDFTRVILGGSFAAALGSLQVLRDRGHGLEDVLLNLLGPSAHLLGSMWQDDLCSFTDVTIGMSRLQQVLREIDRELDGKAGGAEIGRILLCAAPGEQHTFGVSMLEGFFRRSGWAVVGGAGLSSEDILRACREEWLDVVGLSLSGDVLFPAVASAISAVRAVSRNPSVLVLVGGRFFTDNPDRAAEIGADAAASDAPSALLLAQRLSGLAHRAG